MAFSEKLASSVSLRWFMIALLPLLILLRYAVQKADNDVWMHMAMGKYYITHHTLIMDQSIFSWTPVDPTWIYNTCLGSIAVYLFYNVMGGFGLWLLQWFVFLGIFISFYFFLRLIRQPLEITSVTIIAAIGIACSIVLCHYKPELFSALMFCWTVFIFFCVKITRRTLLFYLYPVIFVLWTNLHGTFLVGLVFLALALVGEILNRIFFPKESFTIKDLAHLGGACILSGAGTIINPYGINYLLSLYPTILNEIFSESYGGPYGKFISDSQSLWIFFKEMNAFFFVGGLTVWIMTTMIFSVFGLSVYELIKKRSCDVTLLIVSFALYWEGMGTNRTCYFFPIAFFFIFFYLLIYRLQLKNIPARITLFSLLVFAFLSISVSYFTIRYNLDNTWFGAKLDDCMPVQEVAFLKKYHPEGLIFNDYNIGGYLMWDLYPQYKVFIDTRGTVYRNQVSPDYFKFANKTLTNEDIYYFTKKYPVKIAIMHYNSIHLILGFLKTGEWRLVYFEKNAAILIHQSLFPTVMSQVGNVNLSPVRFKRVNHPEILLNVFKIYIQINPKAAREIYNIYKKNVSDYYKPKLNDLQFMDNSIRLKEQHLQNKLVNHYY